MSILITGGLGYIGSHICLELLRKNYDIVIIDNLANSKIGVLDKLIYLTNKNPKFYKMDLGDNLDNIFLENKISGVIHLAGLKSVGESVKYPVEYFGVNIGITINLLKYMEKYDVKKLIFSSSATVYGSNNISPLNEKMVIGNGITNPYANSKYIIECMLNSLINWNIVSLRYFNPIGSHKLLAENPNQIPNNLMPYILKVASGELECLNIFGNDYDTPDGTAMRDYIHVLDLADAHVKALNKINNFVGNNAINVGNGKPISVLELVNTFNRVNNLNIPYRFTSRREGDLAIVYCDNSLARELLEWDAKFVLEDMCVSIS